MPKYCIVHDMNYAGEMICGDFNGTNYILDDGDEYSPEALNHFDVVFLERDPRKL